MNVVHGTRTSASPCPQPQPKFATQSATASGQWTISEPTRKLLPHPREYERQELLRAAESGRLAFRHIGLVEEREYFAGKGTPRPFTLALPGEMMPTERVTEALDQWMVGITDPKCLYVYKRDALTNRLLEEPSVTPDTLTIKLLSDLRSLHKKGRERANQIIWRVYPRFTSGHLQANGTFSLPKLKPGDYTHIYNFPELVLIHYRKEEIKCFCVYNDKRANIADILESKRQCEKALELKPLPLVVYCHHTGSVQVCFDDELDSPHLANNEHSLGDFAFSQSIDLDNFRAMLNLLPITLRAEALSSELSVPPDMMHKLQQAIELLSDPACYSCERLLELKQSGLPIDQRFVEKASVNIFGVPVKSLLDVLLDTEVARHNGCMEPATPAQQQQEEEEAYRLCQLLLQSGARPTEWGLGHINNMEEFFDSAMPVGIFNCMVAASAPFEFLTLQHLKHFPLTSCSGSVVEFDRICRNISPQQRQTCLRKALLYVTSLMHPTLEHIQCHLLALFHHGASPNKDLLDRVRALLASYYPGGKKIMRVYSPAEYIEWFEKLWEQRNEHPFYQNWLEHVRQAKQEIADLKRSLGINDSGALTTPLAAGTPTALQFMVDAFSKPPVLPDHVGDNEKTILTVLQHYYRRPGPERVIQNLGRQTMPTLWKSLHSCSHVLRARNNGLWYMELLEKFQQCSLSPDEKELLSLAIIYHDAAAEDVDKSLEETRSADYFKRDLAGLYPEQLLDDVALAMVSKENDVNGGDKQQLSGPVRWYLRILRFADRMDIIRGCGVGANFPGFTVTRPLGFDAGRLDLPTQLTREFTAGPDNKTEFQRHLEAAMHGAADLARLTGQLQDQRKKDYTQFYGLDDKGSKISENFEWTTEPVQRMNQFIDDNVRRKMAQQAGIVACSDPSHKACKADQKKGITRGIHNSWYDLRQVELPAGMTLLEKMQYEHDPSLMSPSTQQALEKEVQRLKSDGIRMNLGTLTQATLASEKAQKVLKERGITVISEKRPFVTNDGAPKEWKMLVPKKIAELDDQDAPAQNYRITEV